jgi:ATP-dependent helicase IRC3
MDEDDPFALASDAQNLSHINAMSGFQWVSCGDEVFVIEIVRRGHIRIERYGMEVN